MAFLRSLMDTLRLALNTQAAKRLVVFERIERDFRALSAVHSDFVAILKLLDRGLIRIETDYLEGTSKLPRVVELRKLLNDAIDTRDNNRPNRRVLCEEAKYFLEAKSPFVSGVIRTLSNDEESSVKNFLAEIVEYFSYD